MRCLQQNIELPGRDATARVWGLFDMHLGNALCDEALLDATIARIADDPLAWWIGGGDYADFINRKDPRHMESRLATWLHGKDDIALAQRSRVVEKLKPIAGKCLALLKGNHEESILRHCERDIYWRMVEELSDGRELALGTQGFLTLRLGRPNSRDRRMVVFYLHHGYGGGKLDGGKALALGRLATSYDFDVALMGHVHSRHVLGSQVRLGPTTRGDGRLTMRPMRAAFCGSFLHSVDPRGEVEQYSEAAGYAPLATGSLWVEITPFSGKAEQMDIRVVV